LSLTAFACRSQAQRGIHCTEEVKAAAVVGEADGEAQQAAAAAGMDAQAWQADEHSAAEDEANRDDAEAAALVADASAEEQAAAAWERQESAAARADQQAVAAADATSAHAEASATRRGNDALADAAQAEQTSDDAAAAGHDRDKASTFHDLFVAIARAADNAVHQAASAASQAVVSGTSTAAAEVATVGERMLRDAKDKIHQAAYDAIYYHDKALDRAIVKVQQAMDQRTAAAEAKQKEDQDKRPVAFATTNPPQPRGLLAEMTSYLPSWKTVLFVAGGIALGAAGVAIPVLGAVLAGAAAGVLVSSVAYKVFEEGVNPVLAVVAVAGDVTGVNGIIAGLTNKDWVTGNHLGMTDEQRRQSIGDGGASLLATLFGGFAAKRLAGAFRQGRLAAAGNPCQAQGACFVAGTPMRTPEGSKPIEEIQAGDLVLSRDENDPEGAVVAKVVEEKFVRVAPVLNVRVQGRVIGTTDEHPFYVRGKGWTAAGFLQRGDLLRAEDGWRAVEVVEFAGKVTTVYNMRVSDSHTYFVGSPEWGFSVWAHNLSECVLRGQIQALKEQRASLQIGSREHQAATWRLEQLEGQLTQLRAAKVPTKVDTGSIDPGNAGNTWIKYPNEGKTTSNWRRLEGTTDVQMTLEKYQIGSNPPRSGLGTEYIRQAIQQTQTDSGGRVASVVAKLGEDNLAILNRTGRIQDTPLHKSMVSLGFKNVRRSGNTWIWW
jgi:hypothetical protein